MPCPTSRNSDVIGSVYCPVIILNRSECAAVMGYLPKMATNDALPSSHTLLQHVFVIPPIKRILFLQSFEYDLGTGNKHDISGDLESVNALGFTHLLLLEVNCHVKQLRG